MSDVTVSKSDLELLLRDWGKDYAPAATQKAYRRVRAAMDVTSEVTADATCPMCGGSGMCEQPKPDPYPCPVCRPKANECLECFNAATNGLYCARHAPGRVG